MAPTVQENGPPSNRPKRLMERKDPEKMFDLIARSEIGAGIKYQTPFGYRRVHYCDYTASGRPLAFIEDFIRDEVLPFYANTHTTSTVTALQTTLFRNEARDIIKRCVNANENDHLIFVGSGCTGAVHKLINALNLKEPPIVFVSLFEHHSNILPWRELGAEMVFINEAPNGGLDLDDLERKLKLYSILRNEKRVKIGSFAAASNITGIIVPVEKVATMLHRYGFLSFWDYATAAPHVEIDMNPTDENEPDGHLGYKDAVFVSVHKFIGGPQTPGLLIAKNHLFKNSVPNGCGGGTVVFVDKKTHRYVRDIEEREEGGTPAIVESIRAGLVFQLKHSVGVKTILEKEHYYTKLAIKFFSQIPNIHILGSLAVERLSIFSFLIRNEQTGLFLHSNFVGVLLNDLFGIQSRSGCACAGPYAGYLLNMPYELFNAYEQILIKNDTIDENDLSISHDTTKAKLLKPGFTRFNLSFFFEEEKVEFVLNAIKFVCEHGWKFLPLYSADLISGAYKPRNFQVLKDKQKLSNISYRNNAFDFNKVDSTLKETPENYPKTFDETMQAAYRALEKTNMIIDMPDERLSFNEETSKLRWFLLGSEAYGLMHGIKVLYSQERLTPPFLVRRYTGANTSADLSAIYRVKPFTTNEYENELKFDEYAQHYYYYDKSSSTSLFSTASSSSASSGIVTGKLFRNKHLHQHGDRQQQQLQTIASPSKSIGNNSASNNALNTTNIIATTTPQHRRSQSHLRGRNIRSSSGEDLALTTQALIAAHNSKRWVGESDETEESKSTSSSSNDKSVHSTKTNDESVYYVIDRDDQTNMNETIEKLVLRELTKARAKEDTAKYLQQAARNINISSGVNGTGHRSHHHNSSASNKNGLKKLKVKFMHKLLEKKLREYGQDPSATTATTGSTR